MVICIDMRLNGRNHYLGKVDAPSREFVLEYLREHGVRVEEGASLNSIVLLDAPKQH